MHQRTDSSSLQRFVDNAPLIGDGVAMTLEAQETRVRDARALLLGAGASDLAPRPWQHPKEAPEDAALVRFALWRAASQVGSARTREVAAGLSLIESARSDLDALETALVFTARAEGMTWARIAEAMGKGSPQAAQQRYQRAAERPGPSDGESTSAQHRHG